VSAQLASNAYVRQGIRKMARTVSTNESTKLTLTWKRLRAS
jgi:hypothetical protein